MRALRRAGLSVVGICLLSAALSSVASAADFYESESTSGTTYIKSVGEGNQTFNFGAKVVCKKMSGKAQYPGTTATAVLMTNIAYSECTVAGQLANVNMNGCTIEYDQPTGTSSPFTIPTIKITCPAGSSIVITATTSGCTIQVGSQTTTGTSSATDNPGPPRTITVSAGISGITYTGSGGICGSSGTTGTATGNSFWQAARDAAFAVIVGLLVKKF